MDPRPRTIYPMLLSTVLRKPFFIAKANWFVWTTIANRKAQRLHAEHTAPLSSLQKRILEDLRAEGIATVALAELMPEGPSLQELHTYAEKLAGTAEAVTKKQFLKYYWGIKDPLDLSSPFVQLSLSSAVTGIADAYLGMWTRLKHFTLNLTTPVPKGEAPVQSQRWHRDPQEKRMLKIFLYLSDVDEGAGPFTYVVKSAYGRKYGHLFPQHPPLGCYPPEEKVRAAIDPADMKVMTAPKGTLIFCDTTGIHRGGYATESPRLMYTGFFSAPSYVDPNWYTIPPSLDTKRVSPYLRFKLGLD